MMDIIFGFFGVMMIYMLGVFSGIVIIALVSAGRERDDFEDEISEHRERQSSER